MNRLYSRLRFISCVGVISVATLNGCAANLPTPSATPTVLARTSIAQATSHQPSATALPTPTATPDAKCPALSSDTPFETPLDLASLNSSVLQYLNRGGNPTALEDLLVSSKELTTSVAIIDMDGDSKSEVLATGAESANDQATVTLYECSQSDYSMRELRHFEGVYPAKILFADQLFASQPPYLILRIRMDRGWREYYFAIGWSGSEWQIIELAVGYLPSEIALFDKDHDGVKEAFTSTLTSVSPGGGIGRTEIDTWTWDGQGFTLTASDYPPGKDRVHYLQDAESALSRGNPLLAIEYYKVAARDSSLSSWPTSYEVITNQDRLAKPYQQSYAFFRIVAIWSSLKRSDMAAKYIIEMAKAFPDRKPGNEFVSAAKVLVADIEGGKTFESACLDAALSLNPDVIPQHLGDWGVANPYFSFTTDICNLY